MSFVEAQESMVRNEHDTQSVEDELVRDFYLSFKFSQGSSGYQQSIFDALGTYYQNCLPADTKNDLLAFAENGLAQRAGSLKLPSSHKLVGFEMNPSDPQGGLLAKETFVQMADKLSRKIRFAIDQDEATEPQTSWSILPSTLSEISGGMIVKDCHFFYKPRRIEANTHRSFFREYILLQEPTHSAAFDTIFSQARESFIANGLDDYKNDLERLKMCWEASHPGEKFYPDES